jgi:RNA polymerase sigma-70 factor (ECF subfamily)
LALVREFYCCGAELSSVGLMQGLAAANSGDELRDAARTGDEAAFERLIRPHIAVAYRLAAAILDDASQAEDCVQDATLRAWRGAARLRPGSDTRAWFLTIVANQSRSYRRTRWWSVIRLPWLESTLPSPADDVDRHADLVDALRRLSPDDRGAILLRFYEDMSSREVGQVLGITATGARTRLRRALRRLRVDLEGAEL